MLIYLETEESQNPSEDLFCTSNTSCRCGEDKVKYDANFVACNDGQRKSKCPCLKLGRPCKATCYCKNCANPIAAKIPPNVDISPPSEINRKRKRTGTFHHKRVRSADYLISRNLEPVSKIWIAFEQSLLLTVTAFLVSTLVSPSLENIPRIYNHVAKSQHCQEAGFPIRTKNGWQFAGKLKQLQEKKWGFDQTWYYWYCFDIFQHKIISFSKSEPGLYSYFIFKCSQFSLEFQHFHANPASYAG